MPHAGLLNEKRAWSQFSYRITRGIGTAYNLFFVYFKECYGVDECLAHTFLNLSIATRKIYEQFAAIAM
jgi:hypothetical protein